MIIRSQDKKQITNFNQLTDLCVTKNRVGQWEIIACYPYFADGDCGYAALANYSTEEKALKALDMICEHYQNCEMCKCGLRQVAETEFIFQMPQDSEV